MELRSGEWRPPLPPAAKRSWGVAGLPADCDNLPPKRERKAPKQFD
jgi:hypothetical protein